MEEGRAGPSGLPPHQTAANAESLLSDTDSTISRAHQRRSTDCFDVFCRILNFATGFSALLCAISYGMALAVYEPVVDINDLLDQALRVFGLLGALLVILIEMEWERFLQLVRFTEYWVGRAIVQVFIALLTFKMASPAGRHCDPAHHKDCDFHQSLELYRFVSASALLGCGNVYLLGGLLCFGLIKRSRSRRDRQREQAILDLEQLEKQREALRGLLGRND